MTRQTPEMSEAVCAPAEVRRQLPQERWSESAAFLRRMGVSSWHEYARQAVIFGFVQRRRGITGIALRRLALPWVLAGAKSVIVLEDVVMRGASRIYIGYKTAIEQHVVLDAKSDHPGGIHIGDGVVVRAGGVIDTGQSGFIRIGSRSELGPYAQLRGGGGLEIGEDVLLASNVGIFSTSHSTKQGLPILRQPVTSALTTIGPGCWLGANVVVLPGVTIGRDSIVGANSVVTTDIPPRAVAVGAPARVTSIRGAV
jgi:acetyltransferase-like isoleucine patch superfamily enzyme